MKNTGPASYEQLRTLLLQSQKKLLRFQKYFLLSAGNEDCLNCFHKRQVKKSPEVDQTKSWVILWKYPTRRTNWCNRSLWSKVVGAVFFSVQLWLGPNRTMANWKRLPWLLTMFHFMELQIMCVELLLKNVYNFSFVLKKMVSTFLVSHQDKTCSAACQAEEPSLSSWEIAEMETSPFAQTNSLAVATFLKRKEGRRTLMYSGFFFSLKNTAKQRERDNTFWRKMPSCVTNISTHSSLYSLVVNYDKEEREQRNKQLQHQVAECEKCKKQRFVICEQTNTQ